MAYVAAAAELYSALKGSQAQRQSANFNAAVDRSEASAALGQSLTQEDLVRRRSAELSGRQAGAFGAAGVGYGGSSRLAMMESAKNQEMDALNTRYRGALTAFGYEQSARIGRYEGGVEAENTQLMGGARALNTVYSQYT